MTARKFCAAMAGLAVLATLAPALAQETNADGFRPITAWHAYRGNGVPSQWVIANGLIEHVPGGGDLVSDEIFGNFELAFDWKIAPGGNSGVIYRVSEDYGLPYSSGPEFQVLDNAKAEGGNDPLQQAAGCYGLYAPSAAANPAGDWNTATIVVNGLHVEHWLNGRQVVAYDIGSADWRQRVAASKFAAWPEYGTITKGHIDLQDHGSAVSYRNIRIKLLPDR
jgi:hypothetical protein